MTTSSNWIVLKFGGTSVSSRENWNRIVPILKKRLDDGKKVLVVHSALSQVSNMLEQAIEAAFNGEHDQVIEQIVYRHQQQAIELNIELPESTQASFEILRQSLQGIYLLQECSPRVKATILAQGELLSTTLAADFLQQQSLLNGYLQNQQAPLWCDARELLTANRQQDSRRHYLQAQCNYQYDIELSQYLAEGNASLRLTQGFIASDSQSDTVVLGRGGSDTSAAYFASLLNAEHLEIWTDVPGLFSTNPSANPLAQRIKLLDYSEAQEMASQGAKVLHPCCIEPVQESGIDTYIYSTRQPEAGGTCIQSSTLGLGQAKSVVLRNQVCLITVNSLGMWHQVGFLTNVFNSVSDIGVSVDLVATSQSSVSFTLDSAGGNIEDSILDLLIERLSEFGQVSLERNCSVISIIGRGINHQLTALTSSLARNSNATIKLLSQASSDLNISLVVSQDDALNLLDNLHESLIVEADNAAIFDLNWQQILDGNQSSTANDETPTWWQNQQQQLLNIADDFGSAYVYSLQGVRHQAQKLLAINNCDRIFYAIKANNQPQVLQALYQQGIGFECVSPNELKLVLSLFENIDPKRILFSPNFAPIEDYQYALEQGVHVNLDNIFILQQWPEVFKDQDIILRLDLGQGRGHHDHVKTAGIQSKFGIPINEIALLHLVIEQVGCNIIGLHSHSGSGILDSANWNETALKLCQIAEEFPNVRYIDLGGGLGIVDKPQQTALNLAQLDENLGEIKKLFSQYEFWLEPGRYLVAEQGVLVSRVTQIKGKGEQQYIGIETGMNSLIRPALYGAYHPIANLSRLDAPKTIQANIVGPICESGDKLGVDRAMPETEAGDIIVIANAGAYGATMASDYNLRQRAREITI